MTTTTPTGLRWAGSVPDLAPTLVVVAPHPDDEVLGAAGLMGWAVAAGVEVVVVAVTDGEASHTGSTAVSARGLVDRRREERARALGVLGVEPAAVHHLGLPDADLWSWVDVLESRLRRLLHGDATVVVPAATDRHPDHRATWTAARAAARAVGVPTLEMAIWSRAHGVPPPPDAHVLRLDDAAARRKRDAVACFESQLRPLGPGPYDGPVLTADEVAAMTSSTEWYGR